METFCSEHLTSGWSQCHVLPTTERVESDESRPEEVSQVLTMLVKFG